MPGAVVVVVVVATARLGIVSEENRQKLEIPELGEERRIWQRQPLVPSENA